MVSNLIDKDTRRWKADLVRSLFLPFEASTILNIPLSYNLPEDKIIWVGNKKGEFTVKSAYYIALNLNNEADIEECSSGDCRAPLWKRIWHLKIPSKIRIFGWRACLNGLPTAENLKKRGINLSELCPCCGKDPESITHSLLRCEFAKKVWNCWQECPINISSSQWDFSDVALKILEQGTAADLEVFFVMAWSIWYNRNQVVHESTCQLPNQTWNFAKRYLQDYKDATSSSGQDKTCVSNSWHPPPAGVFKINVDGATSENGRNSSVGVIIRDSKGIIVAACANYLSGQFSAFETETLAVECGILLAQEMGLAQIIIESDALSVIQSIAANEFDGDTGHLNLGIIGLLKSFRSWELNHLKRDYNRVAHELAQSAKRNEASQCWKGVCSPVVQLLIQRECVLSRV
ncbi:uncharacterized protein LOC115968280 [Quercus lobata]|uniref:uncharacterized protein LOC115968280 n=1 Tax=Quercus lobata TaxID=97700 RepID=UPI0012492E52|nr:uncharacterized protein LOC115968280 [Quercus lobata]